MRAPAVVQHAHKPPEGRPVSVLQAFEKVARPNVWLQWLSRCGKLLICHVSVINAGENDRHRNRG
jgi:hypothetical protein